jgi:sterol desaturase/sphingolipid hydroxylase (fatty acid hydroxylase superfamily)
MRLTAIAVLIGIVMFAIESKAVAQRWPETAGWWPRALLLNALGFSGLLLFGEGLRSWLSAHRLFHGERLGVVGGAVVGYLVMSFFNYWWHRLRHTSDFVWRWFHQLHHSAQRIELLTTFYKHPVESLVDGFGALVILYLVVGVSPAAAGVALLLAGVLELFFHWNVKTPHWLGYLIQRPEAHLVHHEAGLHAFNYSDLAIWDILFGTFRNPRQWQATCGLGAANEQRLGEMLRGVDVTKQPPRLPALEGTRWVPVPVPVNQDRAGA